MPPETLPFEDPRTVLKRYGFSPKRSWGQNFLVSSRVVGAISRTAVDSPGRRVLEIGAGVGTLTGALIGLDGDITAIERDRDMCTVLRSEFADKNNFELIEADAKSFDYISYCSKEPSVVAGNLPYQITGPILRKIMGIGPGLLRAVLMVQEEVAERINAKAGEKARGALSVMVRARFEPKVVLRIAPGAFFPPPKVRSAVVALETRKDDFFDSNLSPTTFDKVVKAAFSSRRKYLRNTLVSGGAGTSQEINEALEQAQIDPKLRPEKLKKEDFASIAGCLKKQ